MPKRKVNDYFLYKYRYIIGYILLAVVFVTVLVAAQFVTGGVSKNEMASAVASADLSADTFFSENIVNLPFKVLQKLSIGLFGLSVLSIKLPAAILAAGAGVALLFLLWRWSKTTVVIPAALLIIASSQFLFCAQDGTPSILYILLPVLILLFGHIAGTGKELRLPPLLALSATLAISTYIPFLIYFVIIIAATALIHPRVRFIIKATTHWKLWLALATFLAFIAPLLIASVLDVNTLRAVFTGGVVDLKLWQNAKQVFASFLMANVAQDSPILTPILGLPTTALTIVGFVYGLRQRHRSKYYVIMGWLLIAIIATIVDPRVIALIFAPTALLMTKGLAIVIQKWYDLFPENSYARVAGLVPIGFFIMVVCYASVLHFFLGYHYTPQVAKHYDDDISLVKKHLEGGSVILAKKNSLEYKFYKILEGQADVTVTNQPPQKVPANLVTIGKQDLPSASKLKLQQIVTSTKTDNANRLYVYR
ncbi:MAG: glycosyltransferase family 39 protein [Candidatus Nomurabacteria bacterium]|jgi:hypothetical protein|nr:glycosyltransferase family 39 protein [Candidatus Nomurabacteria bacterium]